MKQHITPEQLQELTPEQQDRLREWWKPEKGDRFVWIPVTHINNHRSSKYSYSKRVFLFYAASKCGEYTFLYFPGKRKENVKLRECLPILSIGQCIELLAEKDLLQLQSIFTKICLGILSVDELINVLWQAVKAVL